MFQIMTELDNIDPTTEVELEVEGDDEEALLYNWLESLLVKFEVNGLLFSSFKIKQLDRKREKYGITAKAYGELYNPEKHESKVAVKAITYHGMEIKKDRAQTTVKVLVDI